MAARGLVLVCVFVAALAGCQSRSPSLAVPTPDRANIPPGAYIRLAYVSTDQLVVNESLPGEPGGTRLGFALKLLNPADGSQTALDIPEDPLCWRELYLNPQALADGRLAFVRSCLHSVEGEPPDEADLVAIAPQSPERLDELMKLGDLGLRKNVDYTVAPDLRQVIYDIGSGPCDAILVATDGQPEGRLRTEVEAGPAPFRLDEPADVHGPCDDAPKAGGPVLSPDGKLLAFVASPRSVGVAGLQARLVLPWDIYLLDMPNGETRRIAKDLQGATSLIWSPDGKKLAYAGGTDTIGLWLIDASTGASQLVSTGDYTALSWSPGGQVIAAVRHLGFGNDGDERGDVVLITLPT